jgi:hypothetical protein
MRETAHSIIVGGRLLGSRTPHLAATDMRTPTRLCQLEDRRRIPLNIDASCATKIRASKTVSREIAVRMIDAHKVGVSKVSFRIGF